MTRGRVGWSYRATSGILVALLTLGSPGLTSAGVTSGAPTAATALTVTSDPVGATVYVDGEPRGKTPVDLKSLRAGDHRLSVAKDGYLENSRVVSVGRGRQTVQVRLTPHSRRYVVQQEEPGPTEEKEKKGGGGAKWLIIGGVAAAAAGTGIYLATKNSPPLAGTIGAAPAGAAIASATAVTFTSQGASDPDKDPLTYRWEFGDGGSATGQQASYTYTRTGTFTVKLTVSDGKKDASTTTTIVVKDLTGTWQGNFANGVSFTITMTQSGADLRGTFRNQFGTTATVNGGVVNPKGMTLRFVGFLDVFTGTADGDVNVISGVDNFVFGSTTFTMRRQ